VSARGCKLYSVHNFSVILYYYTHNTHRTWSGKRGGGAKFVCRLIRDKKYNTRTAAYLVCAVAVDYLQPWHWIRRPRSVYIKCACVRVCLVRATGPPRDRLWLGYDTDRIYKLWYRFLHGCFLHVNNDRRPIYVLCERRGKQNRRQI